MGENFTSCERASDVFVKQTNRWVCVFTQLTRFNKKSPPKRFFLPSVGCLRYSRTCERCSPSPETGFEIFIPGRQDGYGHLILFTGAPISLRRTVHTFFQLIG